MKDWWQQLNLREQRLIASMGGVFIIFVFYSLIWQPLNDSLIQADKKLKTRQALLSWVSDNSARYQQANKTNKKAKGNNSLSSIINMSASRYKLTISRMQPQGESIQVWIDTAPFSDLLSWVEELVNDEGLQITAIDLSGTDRVGEVKIRRLQITKNK